MENKMLALKIYDVDYSFIIKNYLDEKLWEEEWTIFTYKGFIVTLKLSSIDVKSKSIYFEIKIQDNNEENKSHFFNFVKDEFKYVLSTDNIDILKKLLNSTIFQLIRKLEEECYIEMTEFYFKLQEMQEEERHKLKEIAEDFLDSENVYNEEIREAYIDYYIDKNEKIYDMRNDYIMENRYKMITDFYVTFLQATKDEERLNIIRQKIGESQLQKTIKEIKEYEEYMSSQAFQEEMKDNLEEI